MLLSKDLTHTLGLVIIVINLSLGTNMSKLNRHEVCINDHKVCGSNELSLGTLAITLNPCIFQVQLNDMTLFLYLKDKIKIQSSYS